MAESIITLGIGATPEDLTPFITTGLFIGEAVEPTPTQAARAGFVRLGLQLLTGPGGEQLADFGDALVCQEDNGPHGFRSLECFVEMPLALAFVYYDLAPSAWLVLSSGGGVAWEGRVEDRAIVTGGLRLVAFGAWRAMMDVPYTALWSASGTAGWEVGVSDQNALFFDKRFSLDKNNRLFVSPNKDQTFTSGVLGVVHYLVPDGSSRNLTGIEFDYVLDAPSGWQCRLAAMTSGYVLGATIWELTSSGSALSGSVHFSITATAGLAFWLRHNTGTPTAFAGENGASFLKITGLRLVTSVTNRVNTTIAATISSGSQVVTPGSMAGIDVGNELIINSSSASERVVVTAVTSTTFTATFSSAHAAGAAVRIHRIYADRIIKDLVAHVVAVNPDQLSADTSLIESPGLDLLDEVYEDALPGDIATKLAALGDDQVPPRRWEVGVWEDQRLHFRPKGSGGRTWFVEADEAEIGSTLETLYNSVYGLYQDANNRALRTAVADDDDSQARYGIVRRQAVSVSTTSATQANVQRDAALEDGRMIKPRSAVSFEYLTDRAGAIYPKWLLRAGDTLVLANLPPVANEDIDRARTFVVAERSYDAIADDVQPVPEEPPASLDFLVARRDEGF